MSKETETKPGTSALSRLSSWTNRRPLLALLMWALILVGTVGAMGAIGGDFYDEHTLPGSESQELADLLEEVAPEATDGTIQVVFGAAAGVTSPQVEAQVEGVLAELSGMDGVARVDDPYTFHGSISDDETIGYTTLTLDKPPLDIDKDEVRALVDVVEDATNEEVAFAMGGEPIANSLEAAGGEAEGFGMLAALIILVFMFGSLLAASVPLITAIFAVGTALAVMTLLSHVFTFPTYLVPMMMLVGLGVGIDYALLIFARYRSEILRGRARHIAGDIALNTAGRSVLFAGCVVIVALLGLYSLGISSIQALALGVMLTVAVTMLASVTLLPSLLALFGRRLERRILTRQAKRRQLGKAEPGKRWDAWAGMIERRPWSAMLLVVIMLGLLTVPVFGMRLGFADASADDESMTTYQAHDMLSEGFGPGYTGPLIVVTNGTEADAAQAERSMAALDSTEAVAPAFEVANGVWLSTVVSVDSPHAEATEDLVRQLREDVLAQLSEANDAQYLVGGSTAAAIDFAEVMSDKMPYFLALVVGVSTLLLMIVFRSIWIPVKAAALNLLTIGAALGIVTLVFQNGWFNTAEGPIEAFVPVMIFAIVFGLSMDYEVFLVSRMQEEWKRSGNAIAAVRKGLSTTAGVITAAAAIMMVVFGAFILSPDRMMQQFGLGLAIAIFLDAIVIRCLVMPAIMRLLGQRAWWLPTWLDRALPHVTIEPEPAPQQKEPDLVGATPQNHRT
ncbi:MMPL family transporter [Natronoglycomyces albus]|uniref:MMPL family transporter n=1 Tax=Natronoglycomyces albus TaxID=2811108 RepID=A0A895XFK1_9ACTN|nr:MMPL family transporter [Natronoglycomyces albus]QSB04104.1 MMPL family transporter [Natronoglycomyces albus]